MILGQHTMDSELLQHSLRRVLLTVFPLHHGNLLVTTMIWSGAATSDTQQKTTLAKAGILLFQFMSWNHGSTRCHGSGRFWNSTQVPEQLAQSWLSERCPPWQLMTQRAWKRKIIARSWAMTMMMLHLMWSSAASGTRMAYGESDHLQMFLDAECALSCSGLVTMSSHMARQATFHCMEKSKRMKSGFVPLIVCGKRLSCTEPNALSWQHVYNCSCH